ncbi:MAG TPA: hypothetical protein VHX62_05575 [Solirubrobacteraceae bacterium]|jgi:hypothetical protein|nr:hypothetical protein [Solirubrobacteraceae bacterium]
MRAARTLLVVLVALAVPGVALAGKIETGAPGPFPMTGTDHYGKVGLTLYFGNNDKVQSVGSLVYASACSRAGTRLKGDFKAASDGAFAGTVRGYAVSGVVTGAGPQFTVRASVESVQTCHGAGGPVTFTLRGSDL